MSLLSSDRKAGSRTMHAMLTAGIAALVVMQPLSTAPRAQSAPQAAPELVLQTGHTGQINAIALSPDGRFLVSGSSDYTLKIWDIATGNVPPDTLRPQQSGNGGDNQRRRSAHRLERRRHERPPVGRDDRCPPDTRPSYDTSEGDRVQRRCPSTGVARRRRAESVGRDERPSAPRNAASCWTGTDRPPRSTRLRWL